MSCSSCKGPMLPHTQLCWSCGVTQAKGAPNAGVELIEIGEVNAREKVVALLSMLVDEPIDALRTVVSQPPFNIVGTTSEQADRLANWLSVLGARHRVRETWVDEGWRVGIAADTTLAAKLALIVVAGVAAQLLGTTIVLWAAAATAMFISGRAITVRPSALVIDRSRADERLEVLDGALTQEILRIRRELKDEGVLAGIGRCLAEYTSVMGLIRVDGGHLAQGMMMVADRKLQQLMHQALRMAQVAQRSADAEASASALSTDQLRKVRTLKAELLQHIDELTDGLAQTKAQVLGLSQVEARGALSKSIGGLGALVARLEGEVEVAELLG